MEAMKFNITEQPPLTLRSRLMVTAFNMGRLERPELGIRASIDRVNRELLEKRLESSERALKALEKLRQIEK